MDRDDAMQVEMNETSIWTEGRCYSQVVFPIVILMSVLDLVSLQTCLAFAWTRPASAPHPLSRI